MGDWYTIADCIKWTIVQQTFCFLKSMSSLYLVLAHMFFDKYKKRRERWTIALSLFVICFNEDFGKYLIPEDYLSSAENLLQLWMQLPFKQNSPNKPAKYGTLFNSIKSARYPYTHHSHVYCWKREGAPDEFYVSGTFSYITNLVKKIKNLIVSHLHWLAQQ